MEDATGISGLLGWVFAAVGTVTTALAGAVVKLYHKQIADYEERIQAVEQRADECESDRYQLRGKLGEQAVQIARQDSRIAALELQNQDPKE